MRSLIPSRAFTWLTSFVMAAFVSQAVAQEDLIVNAFDTEDEAARWMRWWGSAPQLYEFDSTVDAAGNANSGSLKATVDFDLAAYAGDNQFAVRADFSGGTVDGAKYTNLVFDIRWDSNSPKRSSGDFGYLEYGFRNSDWSQTMLGGMTIPVTPVNGWIHVVVPINPTLAKLENIAGVLLKLWSGSAGGLTGSSVFWVDNVKLVANPNVTTPPPKLAIAPATPGLQLAASASGQQYQRQSIRTLSADPDLNPNYYSWVGNPNPVTFSFTIQAYPDAAHSGFQTHLFLVPENVMPWGPGDSAIDWNATHIVFVQIANNADGTASGRFMYKTNQAGGNSMLWNTDPANGGVGTLGIITNASPLGTWSVTFKNNTDVTLTTPSGASTNVVMPADAAALFADPIYAYFGVQPNQVANIGQSASLSRIQITGVTPPLDDTFTGETLDTTKWGLAAADAPGIVQVGIDAKYWLKWTAPATGFSVQSSPTLVPAAWGETTLTNVVQIGGEKAVVVPASALPEGKTGFFRLMKP